MNRTEHLLACLAEECNEVAQRAMKAQRFGLLEVQPGQGFTNKSRLRQELADLLGVLEMLEAESNEALWPLTEDVAAKKVKVAQYMRYAEEQGALQP